MKQIDVAPSPGIALQLGRPLLEEVVSGLDVTAAPIAGTRLHQSLSHALDGLLEGGKRPWDGNLAIVVSSPPATPETAQELVRFVAGRNGLRSLALICTPAAQEVAASMAGMLHATCSAQGAEFIQVFVLSAGADAFASGPTEDTNSPWPGTLEHSRDLRARGIPVRWLLPLSRNIACRLEGLFSLARDEEIDPLLAPPWPNLPGADPQDHGMDAEDRLFLRDFIAFRLLDEERRMHSPARCAWYQALMLSLEQTEGSLQMAAGLTAIVVPIDTANETLWTVRFENRPVFNCAAESMKALPAGGSALYRMGAIVANASEVVEVLLDGCRSLWQWALARVRPRVVHGNGQDVPRLGAALLVGAYGGDHIGDTAILGGVLLRIHRRYGTTKVILMSQRPDHTRHLVSMLDAPFSITVASYDYRMIRALVPGVEAVVFAGGPLIDLPKQLVRHLYAASLAARQGKPFIMEGIGPGPFPRWPSEWIARRLVRMAQFISVRTSTDANSPLMRGRAPEIGRDPAFDYLATRGTGLTRLGADDRRWIERLLRGTEGRLRIGINLRPIRHHFTAAVPVAQRARHTEEVQAHFEQQFAEGLVRFHQEQAVSPCYVFIPMNAIQFGSSDLRSAYRVHRHLESQVDFRVWQGDASLDGVVDILRELDIVITMRFHATIFALSQNRRVIGVDYRIGQRDKVGALLDDAGRSDHCCRIDELTSDWLCTRLHENAAALGKETGVGGGRSDRK